MRKSLVTTACVLCFSLAVGAMVLKVPSIAFGMEVTVNIHPKTLNLKSNGTWITAYIELPEGFEVSNIDVTTVLLETVPAAWGNVEGNRLMVKFDRQIVISTLFHMGPTPAKELTITGELFDGTFFQGTDTIRVIYKG